MVPVFVAPENGRNFAGIFRDEVRKRISAERVLTTYLDNDDSLHLNFVEDVQRRAIGLVDGTVINYNQGFQFFAEDGYVLRISYPTNPIHSKALPSPGPQRNGDLDFMSQNDFSVFTPFLHSDKGLNGW